MSLLTHEMGASRREEGFLNNACQPFRNVQGEGEGYKRETLGDEVKSRSLCILRTIMQHIFALPFIRMDKECDLVKNESKGRRYLDDIAERIERDFYETIEEIMSDVNCVFEEAMTSDGQLTFAGRTLFYKSEDIEFMASQLKIQFENLQCEIPSSGNQRVKRCPGKPNVILQQEFHPQSVVR